MSFHKEEKIPQKTFQKGRELQRQALQRRITQEGFRKIEKKYPSGFILREGGRQRFINPGQFQFSRPKPVKLKDSLI